MATGGLKLLFVFPLLTALLIAGAVRLSQRQDYGNLASAAPDQVVGLFLRQVHTGQGNAATALLSPRLADIDLNALGTRLGQLYGAPVISSTTIDTVSVNTARVTSDTFTAGGQRYMINWTVTREGDRWRISDVGNLRDLLSDVHGL